MELLVRLNTEKGITVILVTHEEEMAQYAKRCIRFLDGFIQSDNAVGVERECSGTC
jgi:putative ABC transport system ATP-binding protein